VGARDYNTLSHLEYILSHTNTDEQDIVVMTMRLVTGHDGGERELYDENLFTDYERRLFSRVVGLAEKYGRPVDLVIVPATNLFDAVAQTAVRLDSAEIIAGVSSKMTPQEQSRELGRAWERMGEKARRQVRFRIIGEHGHETEVLLGAHAPSLTEEDINLVHKIWLQVSKTPSRRRLHHRDVVRVALERLERDLRGQSDVMLDFYKAEKKEGKKQPDDKANDKATDKPGTGPPQKPK
jgi:hypothetical protein